jgi:nitroreductase/dihydropteridine reductase
MIKKESTMTHQLVEDMQWRYACKKFDTEKKVTEQDMDTLLEVLRLTASSYGMQLWNFVVVENKELREKLVEKSYGQRQVADASHLIVLCIKSDATESDIDAYIDQTVALRGVEPQSMEGFKKMLMGTISKKSLEQKHIWMKNQIYIALGSLLTACAHMRIDSCPMEGISPKGYDELLGLEARGLKAVLACPVGYRSEDDKYANAAKVRFDKETVVTIIQ